MTIHGAKGLEWDVVIVPGLEKKAQANRERLLNWSEIDRAMRRRRISCSLRSRSAAKDRRS